MSQEEVTAKVTELEVQSQSMEVKDDASYQAAGMFLRSIKAIQKQVGSTFDPIVKAAKAAHNVALEQRKKHEQPLKRAESHVKAMIAVYTDEQERIQRVKDAELRAAAEKADEDRRLAEAQALTDVGMDELAEAVLDQSPVIHVNTEPAVQKLDGISVGKSYYAEVVSLRELVNAVAKDLAPIQYLEANMVALNGQARTLKEGMSIPGVELRTKAKTTVR